jgi:hypothetical protein
MIREGVTIKSDSSSDGYFWQGERKGESILLLSPHNKHYILNSDSTEHERKNILKLLELSGVE